MELKMINGFIIVFNIILGIFSLMYLLSLDFIDLVHGDPVVGLDLWFFSLIFLSLFSQMIFIFINYYHTSIIQSKKLFLSIFIYPIMYLFSLILMGALLSGSNMGNIFIQIQSSNYDFGGLSLEHLGTYLIVIPSIYLLLSLFALPKIYLNWRQEKLIDSKQSILNILNQISSDIPVPITRFTSLVKLNIENTETILIDLCNEYPEIGEYKNIEQVFVKKDLTNELIDQLMADFEIAEKEKIGKID
ncbi:MAG: hypothetical protein INQ03_09435 [Candidatus Heimdallarchaeota archaeon]|nr:hypothetical protein [Candidatus Heimdallarchaeota archaeon]